MCLALYALGRTLRLCPDCWVTFAQPDFHQPNARHKHSWFVFPTGPVNSKVLFSGQTFVKDFKNLFQQQPTVWSATLHQAKSWRQRDQGWQAADTQPRTAATFPCIFFPRNFDHRQLVLPPLPCAGYSWRRLHPLQRVRQPSSAAKARGSLTRGAAEGAERSALSLFCNEVHSSTA